MRETAMSFLLDKKQEHEKKCEDKVRAGDYGSAVFHAAKSAEFAYALARQTEGGVQERYLEDAEAWLEIGERLKKQKSEVRNQESEVRSQKSDGGNGAAQEAADEDAAKGDWQVAEKPNVTFDMIAGMHAAKQAIFEMIVFPLQQPEKTRAMGLKPGGGTLFYGPPGTGKTMLAKATANQLDAPFFFASGAEIRSKWHGESEQRLSSLLKTAGSQPLAVLFLDEVEALLPRRGGGSVVDNRIVAQFLADVGGFKDSENILLILAATNCPWDIDDAVFRTGRFDEKLFIPPPDNDARLGILKMNLDGVPIERGFDLDALSQRLEGYSGSDIVGIVNAAKRGALGRSLGNDSDPLLTQADFQEALNRIPSSITERAMKKYANFREQRFK
jgi:transitional endoplasmic reticulum ATPase